MRELIIEEAKPKATPEEGVESKSDGASDSGTSRKPKEAVEPESPSNFKLIDGTIKSETQRTLYKQFMSESK